MEITKKSDLFTHRIIPNCFSNTSFSYKNQLPSSPDYLLSRQPVSISVSQTDSRQSDGLLPRQPVSIGSDGVRLPIFYTPSSTIRTLLYIHYVSRELTRGSPMHLPRQPVSIGSDESVCRHFPPPPHPPSSTIICCICTKSLAN